jgi:hypothetical protein
LIEVTGTSVTKSGSGRGSGVMRLEHGGIDIEEIGELETKDATLWRIKWFC